MGNDPEKELGQLIDLIIDKAYEIRSENMATTYYVQCAYRGRFESAITISIVKEFQVLTSKS